MRYLLDTHAFIWTMFSPSKLSRRAENVISDTGNQIFVSVVSFWQISLKYALKKLDLTGAMPDDLPDAALETGLDILPLAAAEAARSHRLPRMAHRDPFDRLIIWQAIEQKMPLISRDRQFQKYSKAGLKVFW